jgi:hypothetical protein
VRKIVRWAAMEFGPSVTLNSEATMLRHGPLTAGERYARTSCAFVTRIGSHPSRALAIHGHG